MFDEKKFPLAVSLFFTLVYFVCAVLIWLTPQTLLVIMRPMMHGTNWEVVWSPSITFGGFVLGLLETFILSWLLAWFFAKIYNGLK